VSELHTYFVEKRYTESVGNPVVKDSLRLPCSSGRNSFARKLICLAGRSNTVLTRGKSVAPIVPAPNGRNSFTQKVIGEGGRSEPPLPPLSVSDRVRYVPALACCWASLKACR
jgi:hypothetical protein